jgi:hypothetical protein
MKLKSFFTLCLLFGIFSNIHAQTNIPVRLDGPFEGRTLRNSFERKLIVDELRDLQTQKKQRASRQAKRLGIPTRRTLPNGTVQEVVDLGPDGQLVYFSTRNSSARISTAAFQATQLLGLNGDGVSVGVWDAGAIRLTHTEFASTNSRVFVRDGAVADNHATHVGGTIGARGFISPAQGMAPNSILQSFDWTGDLSEMADNASITGVETNKIKISNHSYGFVRGWFWNGSRYEWGGFFGNTASSVDYYFGYYSSTSRSLDSMTYDAPYYLVLWAAGNDRSENPTTGSPVRVGGTNTTYNPTLHPAGDGVYMGGYENIADHGIAKNVLTIGAVTDAVTSGRRNVSVASMTTFSCWGPTDDGRIKPDLVGNGHTVYSPVASTDNTYDTYSGTSMATPNVAGSAALLIEHYSDLPGGGALRASSLKGLLIHTADDLGNAGPDYKNGWGLVNTYAGATLLSDHFQSPFKRAFKEDRVSNTNTSRTYKIYSDGQSPLRATLSWTDPVGPQIVYADDITPVLVNDLNIKVLSPSGEVFYPYTMPFTTEWTLASMSLPATTGVNNRDNVEQVYIAIPPEVGLYTVVVDYVGNLTNNQQDYSLFVSGSSYTQPTISIPSEGYGTFEDTPLENVEIQASQPLLDNPQLVVTASSSNTTLVPNENISITQNAGNYYLTATPAPELDGQTVITVSVWDGFTITTKSFGYDVYYMNDAPVFGEISPVSLSQGQSSQPIVLNISDIDTSLNLVNLSYSSDNGSLLPNNSISFSYDISSGWSMVVSPNSEVSGTANVTINASDLDNTVSRSFVLTVSNTGLTFSDWASQNGIDALDPNALGGDLDQDGLANIMEYFMGLDPNVKEQSLGIWQSTDGTHALLYYKKSKNLVGISGDVKWTTNLSTPWTSQGVFDWLVASYPSYELRCSQVPMPEGLTPVFMRFDLTLD